MIRELKRESAEFKRKYQDCLTEITLLRKERDELLTQKGDDSLNVKKTLDEEKTMRNDLKSEIEKLTFKIKWNEENLQKEVKINEEKAKEIQILKIGK